MKHKQAIPNHRGRRGNHYGDPGKGHPGTRLSRAAIRAAKRTIERRTRRQGRNEANATTTTPQE